MHFNIKWALWICLIPAALEATESVGKVVFVKGQAQVMRVEPRETKHLLFNDPIFPLDALETKDGEIKILFEDQTVMSLSQNSKVLITEQVYKPRQGIRKSIFDILKGKVRTIVERVPGAKENEVQLQTPTAVAGIRGTDIGTYVHGNTTEFLCFDGLIETYFKGLPDQKVLVTAGQQTSIQSAPPTSPENIPAGTQKQFTSQEGPSLKQVLKQSGGEGLNRKEFLPPPPTSPQQDRNQNAGQEQKNDRRNEARNDQRGDSPSRNAQGPGQQPTLQNFPSAPPPPPPILPGGNNETPIGLAPPGAAGSPGSDPTGGSAGSTPAGPTTTPVDVPVTFPTPG